MFGGLKDRLPVAMRYDRCQWSSLSAIAFAALVNFWLRVPGHAI